MGIGTSLVLIAVGAILRFAITESVQGIKIDVVGTILMVIGILGLVISLLYMFLATDRRTRDPRDPYDAPTRRRP
jgi:hypothetical protein